MPADRIRRGSTGCGSKASTVRSCIRRCRRVLVPTASRSATFGKGAAPSQNKCYGRPWPRPKRRWAAEIWSPACSPPCSPARAGRRERRRAARLAGLAARRSGTAGSARCLAQRLPHARAHGRHEGRHDKAFSLLEELRAHGVTRRMPRLHFAAQCEMVRQHARAGRGETADALVRQLSATFASQKAQFPKAFLTWLELQLELAKVHAALAHQGADHMLDALQEVDRAAGLAAALNLGWESVEIRMLRSLVLERCGDAAAAAEIRREGKPGRDQRPIPIERAVWRARQPSHCPNGRQDRASGRCRRRRNPDDQGA